MQASTLGVEELALLSGEELHAPSSYLVFLNGSILGVHRKPHKFAGENDVGHRFSLRVVHREPQSSFKSSWSDTGQTRFWTRKVAFQFWTF
jgi:hypothetical protein